MSQMSTGDRLVYMANQIALNFAIAGEEKAALATADHIGAFWDPRMKERVFARADTPDHGLSAIAVRAITLLKQRRPAPPHTAATIFNHGGQFGHSDAG